jgi:hypothetical protein
VPTYGLRGSSTDTEAPGHHQVVGRVDIATQSRPGAGQFDGPRLTMALGGINAEFRVKRDSEGKQC